MKILRWTILVVLVASALELVALPAPVMAQGEAPKVYVITFNGELTQPWVEYLNRAIRTAEDNQAEALMIDLDTPGGRVDLMKDLKQIIRGSPVPVVVYVTPRGAWAASAGTVITLAGHAAAMAPETTIGAASPVGGQGEDLGETIAAKEKEALRADIRGLTQRRPQEAIALAEDMIENAKAVSASEALEIGLIDFIAPNRDDLLRQLDGYRVFVGDEERVLHTAGAEVIPLRSTFMEQLLSTLVNANVVFLLLTIGVQAILIELGSPGGWVAGFIGVVALALAIYGLGILPVNWFGIIFFIIAFVLFFLDIKAPTHGALTAAGVGSFIAGALILFNSPEVPRFQRVSVPLVVGTGLITAAVFFTIVSFGVLAQRRPVSTGMEALAGRRGTARSTLSPQGMVQVAGELWSAELADGQEPVEVGAPVVVVSVEGLRLRVKKI